MASGCVPDDCTGEASAGPGKGLMPQWHLTHDEFHWLVLLVDWQHVKGP